MHLHPSWRKNQPKHTMVNSKEYDCVEMAYPACRFEKEPAENILGRDYEEGAILNSSTNQANVQRPVRVKEQVQKSVMTCPLLTMWKPNTGHGTHTLYATVGRTYSFAFASVALCKSFPLTSKYSLTLSLANFTASPSSIVLGTLTSLSNSP